MISKNTLSQGLCCSFQDELEDSPNNATVSPYAKTTDTGVDPRIKAQRLKVDWDEAAEIQTGEESDDPNVPPVVVCCSI